MLHPLRRSGGAWRKVGWRTLPGVATLAFLASAGATTVQELETPILAPNQPTAEVQVFTGSRVPVIPPVASAGEWEREAARLRGRIVDDIFLRGEAAKWKTAVSRTEWLDTIERGQGYRIRKLRFEAVPGLWVPALLYEPTEIKGKVPVVLNLNGHEKSGTATPYIQERCINLAKRGILALNPEWLGRGQLLTRDFSHYRLNQLDLCGTSGIGVFYLSMVRSLDILLALPNADTGRVAVTGLSGGGWQTIMLSALDTRVKLANPVAGFSSYMTRTQFPSLDLGDSEQTPSDFATVADYTHLTALMAPRRTLLTYNALDTCCFVAGNSLAPLLQAASPVFRLFGAGDRLNHHVNHDPGHNYGQDNREAFYRMLRDEFYGGDAGFSVKDIPSGSEIRTAEELRVPLPDGSHDFHSLAVQLSASLPRKSAAGTQRLAELVRAPRYQVHASELPRKPGEGNGIARWRLRMDNDWTVPAIEFSPREARGTVLVVADEGRKALAAEVDEWISKGWRVVAVDPFGFGESRVEKHVGLWAILVAAVGERPLGIQAGQVAAVARWLKQQHGNHPVQVVSVGPRAGLFSLIAAVLEPDAIDALEQIGAMTSLKEVIAQNLSVDQRPEQFCFGLLEEFDLPEIESLVGKRPLRRR